MTFDHTGTIKFSRSLTEEERVTVEKDLKNILGERPLDCMLFWTDEHTCLEVRCDNTGSLYFDLETLRDEWTKKGMLIKEACITYLGDADAIMHLPEKGSFEDLSLEDYHIRTASSMVLKKELERRGFSVI